MRKHRARSILTAATLILAAVQRIGAASDGPGLVVELARLERQFGIETRGDTGANDLQARVEDLASGMNAASVQGDPGVVVSALNRLIFEKAGIVASQDLKVPDNLFPSRVLDRKQGYCVGIAALYLALSERLGLPIYAVATPSHVFLRYEDGATRINIETLQQGANIGDDQYIREQRIPEQSIRRGVFMRNLTTDEFLAQIHNNLGVIYSARKNREQAVVEYERALDLDPRLPAAHYNYGTDLLRTGEYRRAARQFSKSLRFYPTDVWALNNRAMAYLKMGKRDKARRDFQEALKIDPGFEQARRNLETTRPSP